MSIIVQKDMKINSVYENGEAKIFKKKKPKIAKDLILFFKTKQKVSMANKLLKRGKISDIEHHNYVKKVLKEKELISSNAETYEEVIFESDCCSLKYCLKGNKIVYSIEQCGVKTTFDDYNEAIENFVFITM